jgi:hypothetical protein
MIFREELNRLKTKRRYWKKKLLSVIDTMAPITISRSYHVCGNPSCKKCREAGGKHGPFLYTTYKDEERKTHTFYVSVELEHLADEAYKAWVDFKEIGRKIGEINRDILKLKLKGRRKR